MRKAQGGFRTYERGGKWWVRWSETNADGKRYTARESLGLATDSATEQDADQVAAERLAGRIARKNDGSKSSVTLAHAVEKFLAALSPSASPNGTLRMYTQKWIACSDTGTPRPASDV